MLGRLSHPPLLPPLAHRAPLQLVSFESMPGRGYRVLHGRVSSHLLLVSLTFKRRPSY